MARPIVLPQCSHFPIFLARTPQNHLDLVWVSTQYASKLTSTWLTILADFVLAMSLLSQKFLDFQELAPDRFS